MGEAGRRLPSSGDASRSSEGWAGPGDGAARRGNRPRALGAAARGLRTPWRRSAWPGVAPTPRPCFTRDLAGALSRGRAARPAPRPSRARRPPRLPDAESALLPPPAALGQIPGCYCQPPSHRRPALRLPATGHPQRRPHQWVATAWRHGCRRTPAARRPDPSNSIYYIFVEDSDTSRQCPAIA